MGGMDSGIPVFSVFSISLDYRGKWGSEDFAVPAFVSRERGKGYVEVGVAFLLWQVRRQWVKARPTEMSAKSIGVREARFMGRMTRVKWFNGNNRWEGDKKKSAVRKGR